MTDKSIKGISAFYLDRKYFTKTKVDIIKEDFIHKINLFNEYPDEIKEMRNSLIYLTSIQIAASLFGMLYIIIRRSYLYIFINIISIILALIGLYGALVMSGYFLIIHCFFTTSLTGGFSIFQIIDFILVKETTHGQEKRLGDSFLLIIFSLPYVYDCFTGIFNFRFLYEISKFMEKRKEQKGLYNNINNPFDTFSLDKMPEYNDIINHIHSEEKCIICCEQEKNAVLAPCGHMLSCFSCANQIMENKKYGTPTCPACRKKINNIIRYYPI